MRPDDDLDTYLDSVLVGGRERVEIVVVGYDPGWPSRYEQHRRRLVDALGPDAHVVEHIGSTAVPGLAAKPIIDIAVTVADVDDEQAYGPALVRAGYQVRVRERGHRMFRTPERDVHIHLFSDGAPEVGAYLALRDHLRATESDRARYAAVKKGLATRQWRDMNHYAAAKSEVIGDILARARGGPGAVRPGDLSG